jgi:mono/diheme cytochrome c family protein
VTKARRAGFVALALGILAVGGLVLWDERPPGAGMRTDDPDVVAQGAAVYGRHCAACHGENLEGQPEWRVRKVDGRLPAPPHDATGHTWHHPAQQLFELTRYGLEPFTPKGYESDMPAFEGVLSDQEIWAVLSFIKSRWPDEIQRRHGEMSVAAE